MPIILADYIAKTKLYVFDFSTKIKLLGLEAKEMRIVSRFYEFLFSYITIQLTDVKDCGDGIIRGVNLGRYFYFPK